MNAIITRFAPSPTGNLHIGGLRTALINYIVTHQFKKKFSDSKFLLRIEDTDKQRSKKEFINSIVKGLEWMGINWDDEIYFQSKRILRHQEIAIKLLNENKAYKCICTKKQIDERREKNLIENKNIKRLCINCMFDETIQKLDSGYCIRLKIPNDGNIEVNDIIQGKVIVDNKELDNFIILRNDKTPTYMLSVVVDDHDMNVNVIIRGNDHLNNTFKQNYLYKNLDWKIPQYAHLPLIHGQDGTKLSKRHGAVNINEFNTHGYIPKAIINNLILLGWSPKKEKEFIELEEIIDKFDIKSLTKSSSIFDYNKLDFLNNYYLQKNENYQYFISFINKDTKIKKYINLDKNKIKNIYFYHNKKIKKLSEYKDIISIFFDQSLVNKKNKIFDDLFNNLIKKFIIDLEKVENWNIDNIEIILQNFIKNEKITFPSFAKPLRFILTNNEDGISISEIMYILSEHDTFLRINNYIKNINKNFKK